MKNLGEHGLSHRLSHDTEGPPSNVSCSRRDSAAITMTALYIIRLTQVGGMYSTVQYQSIVEAIHWFIPSVGLWRSGYSFPAILNMSHFSSAASFNVKSWYAFIAFSRRSFLLRSIVETTCSQSSIALAQLFLILRSCRTLPFTIFSNVLSSVVVCSLYATITILVNRSAHSGMPTHHMRIFISLPS